MGLTKLKHGYSEVPVPLGLVYEFVDYIMAQAESDEERTGAGHVGQCCEASAVKYSYEELVERYCVRVPEQAPWAPPLPDEYFLHGTGYHVQPELAPAAKPEESDEDYDDICAGIDEMKWESRMWQHTSLSLLDTLLSLQQVSLDEAVLTGQVHDLSDCIHLDHNYEFLRTLHSSGLALKFEQALALAAERAKAA